MAIRKTSKKTAVKRTAGKKKATKRADPAHKDDKDVVIFFEGDYFYLPVDVWTKARKLGEGEQSVLVPLIDNGAVVAHVDQDSPKFGTWTNLVNLSALLLLHKKKRK